MDKKTVSRTVLAVLGLMACWTVLPSDGYDRPFSAVTNYPNPFDSREGSTTICYTLTSESEVGAKIYDLLGNLVREYPARIETPGIKTVVWDGTDQQGSKVSKGGYILALEIKSGAAEMLATRKIGVLH